MNYSVEQQAEMKIDSSDDDRDSITSISSPFHIFDNNCQDDGKYLPKEIETCFKVGIEAALEAGQLIETFINDTQSKSQSKITKNFPFHNIIAEESTNKDEFIFSDNVTWIIDPIDGTTNFLHGHNNVGICIGIKYKKVSVLGIVYIPIWNELYFAVKGKGSYMMSNANKFDIYNSLSNNMCPIERIFTNKKHTKISEQTDLESAMFLLESGYKRDEKHCKFFGGLVSKLLSEYKVRAIRMFGCCSVHMCCIASGRADVFFETGNLKPWDMVAGQVIVNEAE